MDVTILLIVISSLLFLTVILLTVLHFRLKSRIDRLIGGSGQKETIEARLNEINTLLDIVYTDNKRIDAQIENLYSRLAGCIQKVGIVRYNPFADMGGDLSFALTLLDQNNNGVVINTVYGRDATYTYAKPIVNQKCDYTLSDEEQQSIKKAVSSFE